MDHRPAGHDGPFILIYVDASCIGNPGPGAYAAVLRRIEPGGRTSQKRTITKTNPLTTNQRAELQATIDSLEALKRRDLPVVVVTNNQYVHKGAAEWLPGWKARDWRKPKGQAIANADLWRRLEEASSGLDVRWLWAKSHGDSHMGNEVSKRAGSEARGICGGVQA